MSRPKPTILLSAPIDSVHSIYSQEILQAKTIYAVFYEDKPINLRRRCTAADLFIKYKRTSFSNPGHAYLLQNKLNKIFNTDKFTVRKFPE